MKSVSNDARGFIEGVVSHLKQSGKVKSVAPKVQVLLRKMTSAAKREHEARVESAIKLSPTETQAVARILSRISGHDVSVTSAVDPALVGGMRITMADWVMDTSITDELAQMAALLV